MELGYPGGPQVSRLAKTGNKYFYSFPRPMLNKKNYDFSFSGLKTAVLYKLRDLRESKTPFSKNDICASFEDAVVDVLLTKTERAAKEFNVRSIIVGGGVAANGRLREKMEKAGEEDGEKVFFPEKSLSIDNGAMIAAAAFYEKNFVDPLTLRADSGLHF